MKNGRCSGSLADDDPRRVPEDANDRALFQLFPRIDLGFVVDGHHVLVEVPLRLDPDIARSSPDGDGHEGLGLHRPAAGQRLQRIGEIADLRVA